MISLNFKETKYKPIVCAIDGEAYSGLNPFKAIRIVVCYFSLRTKLPRQHTKIAQ